MALIQENIDNLSDEENELNVANVPKSRKTQRIIDSDSEPEGDKLEETENVGRKSSTPSDVTDDDNHKTEESENERTSGNKSVENNQENLGTEVASDQQNEDPEDTGSDVFKPKTKQRIKLIDSDSDSESSQSIIDSNASHPVQMRNDNPVDSEGESSQENEGTVNPSVIDNEFPNANSNKSKYRLDALYDSDSAPEDVPSDKEQEEVHVKAKVYKKKQNKNEEPQPKKINAKEAAKLRNEIQSESQRMLRESGVSLPYHKPKAFSIKEFLEKRSKLSSALPSVAIKMPKEKLIEVSKQIDERMKLVEELYKSESEEEEITVDDFATDIKSCLDSLIDKVVKSLDENNDEKLDDVEMEEEQLVEEEKPESGQKNELVEQPPRLSWGKSAYIDLNEDADRSKKVNNLVEKLFRHTLQKSTHKHKVETKVLGFTQGEIIDENIAINIDDEEEHAIIETPGAKLNKLRQELENQMALKRAQIWKEKQQEIDKIIECKEIDDELFNEDEEEEEAEMTESSSDDELEKYEAEIMKEKPRKKSAFVENEADVDEEIEEDNEEADDEEEAGEADDEDEAEEGDDEDEDVENEEDQIEHKSKGRILKPFTEDSDNEETEENPQNTSLCSTISDEDYIPPNLPKTREETPQKPPVEKDIDFLTPVTYLTGLQNLQSASKFAAESPISKEFLTPDQPAPQKVLHKQLFIEPTEPPSQTQDTVDELAALCTGSFTTQMKTDSQNLLALCSGTFSDTEITPEANKQNDELQISQLMEGEELEKFKKNFESPIVTKESDKAGVLDSDEEVEGVQVKTKTNKKKLTFSDDESESSEPEEEIGLHDEDEEIEEKPPEDVEYDSEENEIERPKGGARVQDFFEKEAELSESEWDSADEDEKDLDLMDFEQGDKEKFDNEKLRSDIEKIHMRQVLDDDNRDVKILQELLLEDGELHGAGRQRQYRWKNMDSGIDGETTNKKDEIELEDEENKEEWRKLRHKREMFLKQQAVKDDIDKILEDSQILKFGKTIVEKTSQTPPNTQSKSLLQETSLSLSSKRGSFLSRSDQVLQRLAEYNKVTEINITGAKNSRGFVFQSVETRVSTSKETFKRKAAESTPNILKKLRLSDLSPAASSTKSSKAKKLF